MIRRWIKNGVPHSWWGKMVIYPALRNFHPQRCQSLTDHNRSDRLLQTRTTYHRIDILCVVEGWENVCLGSKKDCQVMELLPLGGVHMFPFMLLRVEHGWRYSQNILTTWIKPTALCSDLAAPKERDGTDPVTEMEMISHPGKVPEVTGAPEKSAGWLIWEDRLSPNVMLYQHLCH